MTIDWGAFAIVALTSLVATAVIVSLYSLGVRLLSVGRNTAADDGEGGIDRPLPATVGAVTCFVLCAAAVLFGIYLIVPFFH